MKISIIIPTHNRAESLKKAIDSIIQIEDEANFELIIVDNNSTDNTKAIVENYSQLTKYVFEKNTAFTKARQTGAENSSGDILLFLDDDVIVCPKSLISIVKTFNNFPDCGVIAGKILPYYESNPPDWALACQSTFNGWSLYNPTNMANLGIGFQEVTWAAGPMMAISRKAYISVDGFPPDTVGVETGTHKNTFRKLYVGPGDYGICNKIRKSGFKVYYVPDVSCFHVILPIRFSVSFWRSRMIGEAHHRAITNREFYNFSNRRLWQERMKAKSMFEYWNKVLSKRLKNNETYTLQNNFNGMFFEELWLHYYKTYLDMDRVLVNNPGLSKFLWEIGLNGVADNKFEQVVSKLPIEFIIMTESEVMYSEDPITSIDTLELFGFTSSEELLSLSERFFYFMLRLMIRVRSFLS